MSKDLADLRDRKQELLLESEINRQILVLEASQVKLKAIEWRGSLLKAGAVYKWVAPLAGVAAGILVARKQATKAASKALHNGRSRGKLGYLQFLAPLGLSAVRQVLKNLRQPRGRAAHGSAE